MRTLTVWLLLLLVGCSIRSVPQDTSPDAAVDASADVIAATVVPTTPGQHEVVFTSGGVQRKFLLAIPPNYDGSKPLPLLFVFHGFNHSALKAATQYGIHDVVTQRGWIAVYGDGLPRPDEDTARGWNAYHCCGYAHASKSDDVAHVRSMLALLEGALQVDKRRIYATSFSNGSMFTHRLGIEMGDRLAAIAPVAGALSGITLNTTERTIPATPVRQVPMLAIHGRKDPTVPFDGGKPEETTHDSVAVTIAFWVKNNGCNPTPTTTQPVAGVERTVYSGCAGGSEVQLIATDEGLHAYLLLERYGTETATVVLDFLERFTLPTP
jgi:polyhydroxybutyrate depolymerase